MISRTALVAEVETTLMLPASKAAEIEMAVEKAEPTTAPESMKSECDGDEREENARGG